MGVVFKLLAHI